MDGTRVHYLVSQDGRLWGRPDLGLTYVLAEPPTLVEDPAATDPTPAWPLSDAGAAPGETSGWLDAGGEANGSVASPDAEAPVGQLIDPDAPLSGEFPLGPPPEVRLRPLRVGPAASPESEPFDARPEREPPDGFGLDPFAPDPNAP